MQKQKEKRNKKCSTNLSFSQKIFVLDQWGRKLSPLSVEPLLVSDNLKKGTYDAFYVTICHFFGSTFFDWQRYRSGFLCSGFSTELHIQPCLESIPYIQGVLKKQLREAKKLII